MKRVIYFLSSILFFNTSCDTNDDSGNPLQSFTIVGTWNITSRTVDVIEEALGECEPFNVYNYEANGTYIETIYAAVQGSSSCLDNPFVEFTGTWTKNFDDTYKFTNSDNQVSNRTIIFLNANEFYFEYNVISSDTDPTIVIIRETYSKI